MAYKDGNNQIQIFVQGIAKPDDIINFQGKSLEVGEVLKLKIVNTEGSPKKGTYKITRIRKA